MFAKWFGSRWRLPKLRLPKLSLPKPSLPKPNLPKLRLPKLSLPKPSLPKPNLPKLSWPPKWVRALPPPETVILRHSFKGGDLAELCPGVEVMLAQTALLSELFLESLENIPASHPETVEVISRLVVAEKKLRSGIEADKDASLEADARRVMSLINGRGEYVDLLSYVLVSELLGDFYNVMSLFLPPEDRERFKAALLENFNHKRRLNREAMRLLSQVIKEDPQQASLMSLWGRRLVGDMVLLIKRSVDAEPANPALSLTASRLANRHAGRMKSLGLVA